MGKIGQNPKIWQLWRPVAPQPYVVHKSWPNLGNFLALGLQRGLNNISLQCIAWPAACSEWGAWPLKLKFSKYFSGSSTGPKYVLCPNLVEIGRCEVVERSSGLPHKKIALRGTSPSPHFAQNKRSRQKFPESCHLLTCPRLRFAGLIAERLIFRTEK